MVFAYAAVSAAQKPRHPFGAGHFHSHTGNVTASIRHIQKIGYMLIGSQQGGGRVFARHW